MSSPGDRRFAAQGRLVKHVTKLLNDAAGVPAGNGSNVVAQVRSGDAGHAYVPLDIKHDGIEPPYQPIDVHYDRFGTAWPPKVPERAEGELRLQADSQSAAALDAFEKLMGTIGLSIVWRSPIMHQATSKGWRQLFHVSPKPKVPKPPAGKPRKESSLIE